MVEEDRKRLEINHENYTRLIKDFTYLINPDLYKIVYTPKSDTDPDYEGVEISENEIDDVMAFLQGKRTLNAKDILKDSEGWL